MNQLSANKSVIQMSSKNNALHALQSVVQEIEVAGERLSLAGLVQSLDQAVKDQPSIYFATNASELCIDILHRFGQSLDLERVFFQDSFFDVLDGRWSAAAKWVQRREVIKGAVSTSVSWALKYRADGKEEGRDHFTLSTKSQVESALELGDTIIEECSMVIPIVKYNCFRLVLDANDARKIYIDLTELSENHYYPLLVYKPTSAINQHSWISSETKVMAFVHQWDEELYDQVSPVRGHALLLSNGQRIPGFLKEYFDVLRKNRLPTEEPSKVGVEDPFALAKRLNPSHWLDDEDTETSSSSDV